jgi:two-component system C4-dicarboxylate transport sensor histidine kinase DctB
MTITAWAPRSRPDLKFSTLADSRRVFLALAVFILVGAIAVWEAASVVSSRALREIEAAGFQRIELYSSTVSNALATYAYLPAVLARDSDIAAAVSGADSAVAAANAKLRLTNENAHSAAIYVMDTTGLTRASSNFDSKWSFVGQNYSFRPYFIQAMQGQPGHFYGVGSTTNLAGYFISSPIYSAGDIVGVVVVKIDLEPLQAEWASGGERLFVMDRNKVVILSSYLGWKYGMLHVLGPGVAEELKETQEYGNANLRVLAFKRLGSLATHSSVVEFEKHRYLMQTRNFGDDGWTIGYLSDIAPVDAKWREVVISSCAVLALLVLLGLFFWQRRLRLHTELRARKAVSEALRVAHDQLEQKVRERTLDLEAEISERQKAEIELRSTQEELIHAGKMAALGQMSAAIAHEINQPLAAIQTFSASTRVLYEKDDKKGVSANLEMIASLTKRLAGITSHLRTFSHKSAMKRDPVSLEYCVDRALALLQTTIDHAEIEVVRVVPDDAVVCGNEIRLEQVLVNLIRNAIDAMQGRPIRKLTLQATREQKFWVLRVGDTGSGIEQENLSKLFEPFFSTKNAGVGLGLGLSLSYTIIRGFGGSVTCENNPDGGASFYVKLPMFNDAGDHA